MDHSLVVRYQDNIVFASDSHWLYPLFELSDFLSKKELPVAELFLQDKIAGKAAACIMVYLGIKRCHIELLSKRAVPIFEQAGIRFTYDQLVDNIFCSTETLIADEPAIDDVWLFLRKRAGKVEGLPVKLENITVTAEAKIVLDGLSLDLSAGEQLLIYGANGTGKTTLLKTILGLVKPVKGIV